MPSFNWCQFHEGEFIEGVCTNINCRAPSQHFCNQCIIFHKLCEQHHLIKRIKIKDQLEQFIVDIDTQIKESLKQLTIISNQAQQIQRTILQMEVTWKKVKIECKSIAEGQSPLTKLLDIFRYKTYFLRQYCQEQAVISQRLDLLQKSAKTLANQDKIQIPRFFNDNPILCDWKQASIDSFNELYSFDISPDGKYIVSGDKMSLVRVWHPKQLKMLSQVKLANTNERTSVMFTPCSSLILSGVNDQLDLWTIELGRATGQVDMLHMRYALVRKLNVIIVYRHRRNNRFIYHQQATRVLNQMKFSRTQNFILALYKQKYIRIIESKKGKLIRCLNTCVKPLAIQYLPNEEWIAYKENDNVIVLYDVIRCTKLKQSKFRELQLSPDKQFQVTAQTKSVLVIIKKPKAPP